MASVGMIGGLLAKRLKLMGKLEAIHIDHTLFQLHYRVTFMVFVIFSALVTCTSLLGKPIACIKSGDVPQKIIDNYCWIEGTFTLPKALIKTIEFENAHPGVRQFFEDKDEILEHTYYQWVSTVLFFQALSFYVTRFLWKRWEGGLMQKIIGDLNKCIIKKEQSAKHANCLVSYLYRTRGTNSSYAARYLLCEVLNVVNVLLQFYFINWFLGGQFYSYGFDIMSGKGPDPLTRIFPKMTKCTFHQMGPSGDVQKYDNLCLLPLNILNEKGYILVWFWLAFLGLISLGSVLYSLVVIVFPRSRYLMLHNFNRLVPEGHFVSILNHVSYGDWFVLYMLSKNLDPFHYRDVVMQLSHKLDGIESAAGGQSDISEDGSHDSKSELTKADLESQV